MSTTETAESWLGRVPRTPRREQQPWRTPEDAAGWTRIHRGPGAGELPLIGVEVDLDRPESEWLRREAERTGLGYTEIVKRLVEEARRADERREARAKKRAGWPTTRPLRRRSHETANPHGCSGAGPSSSGGRSGARSRARARSRLRPRRQPGPERVAGVLRRVEPGRSRGALDDPRDGAVGQPAGQQSSVPVDAAEERPIGDRRRLEPSPQSAHRAGGRVRAVRDSDLPPLALLVGLRAPERHDQAIVRANHVVEVQGDQLGAPERAGEAQQQQRPVADLGEGFVDLEAVADRVDGRVAVLADRGDAECRPSRPAYSMRASSRSMSPCRCSGATTTPRSSGTGNTATMRPSRAIPGVHLSNQSLRGMERGPYRAH
jgi:hypothetical protein